MYLKITSTASLQREGLWKEWLIPSPTMYRVLTETLRCPRIRNALYCGWVVGIQGKRSMKIDDKRLVPTILVLEVHRRCRSRSDDLSHLGGSRIHTWVWHSRARGGCQRWRQALLAYLPQHSAGMLQLRYPTLLNAGISNGMTAGDRRACVLSELAVSI